MTDISLTGFTVIEFQNLCCISFEIPTFECINVEKQLLDDLKEMRRYFKLAEEALDHNCGELSLEKATNLS